MNELQKRSLTGVIYVIALLSGLLLHPLLFTGVFGLVLFFLQVEFFNLFAETKTGFTKWFAVSTGMVLFLIGNCVAGGILPINLVFVFIPVFFLIFLAGLINPEKNKFKTSLLISAGLLYTVLPFVLMSFMVFPKFTEEKTFYGMYLAGIFFIVWVYDSLAYIGGTFFGKHKLAKKISPNKTWEGVLIGAVFAVVTGILNAVVFQKPGISNWIITALLVVVFGTLGDLFESNLKRELEIKDTGTFLPGHGGFLDRFDSVLFAIPFVYFWMLIAGNF